MNGIIFINNLTCSLGYNGVIKNTVTFRERMDFAQFSQTVLEMATGLSIEYMKLERVIALTPTITVNDWRKAAAWANEKLTEQIIVDDNTFLVPSTKALNKKLKISQASVKKIEKTKWESFDKYVKDGSGLFWRVSICKENWKMNSFCNCPFFQKNFKCKHIIGISLRLKLCKLPRTAITTEIGSKPKRGRKTKSYKALLQQ